MRRLATAHPWLPALGCLAAAWTATFLVDPWADVSLNDVGLYRAYAAEVLGGSLPYRDFFFEYPPLAPVPMALAGLFGTGQAAYEGGFAAVMLACSVALLVLCAGLARRSGGAERLALAGVAAAPLLTGAMARTHFDLLPVAITVGALVALLAGRTLPAFALLGVGAATKLFPFVVAPVAVAWLVGRGERREALRGALTLVVTVSALVAAAVLLDPGGAVDAASFHLERPVLSESSPASILWALEGAGVGTVRDVPGYRSHGIGHQLDGPVTVVFAALAAVLVGLFSALAAEHPQPRQLVLGSLGAVVASIAFAKVLSPQFLVWTIPLLALTLSFRLWAAATATATAIGLTLVFFPSRYLDLLDHEPLPIALLALRNLALVASVALVLRALVRERGRGPELQSPDGARREPALP